MNIEKGSIKHLIIMIITIAIMGIILFPIYDLLYCKLISKAVFVYSFSKYVTEPIVFGAICGIVFWVVDRKRK